MTKFNFSSSKILKTNIRIGIVLVLLYLLLPCSQGLAQWTEISLPPNPNYMQLKEIEWADSLHGYLWGRYYGYYLKTTDGGTVWALDSLTPKPDSAGTRHFEYSYVDFKSKEFGVVVYKDWDYDSLLYVTTNGGKNWQQRRLAKRSPAYGSGWLVRSFSQIRVHSNGGLYFFYSRVTDDKLLVNVIEFSDDLGESWREIAVDTLVVDLDFDMPGAYVMIDSLTHYHFSTATDAGDYYWSWVKVTIDGGASWHRITWPSHPLNATSLNGYIINRVRMHSDTSFTVRLSPGRGPGPDPALTTIDIKNHITATGWYWYTHPYESLPGYGKRVRDLIHVDGTYMINVPDSLLVFRENGPLRALKIPMPTQTTGVLRIQHPGKLWYLAGNRLFKLDFSTLGRIEETPEALPGVGELECYPNPLFGTSRSLKLKFISSTHERRVSVTVHDILGRLLFEKEFQDIREGVNILTVDSPLGHLDDFLVSSPLFIRVDAEHYRFVTKIYCFAQ